MALSLSRRRFLQTAAVAAPTILTPALWGDEGAKANDRITLGFIGVGTMGRGHVRRFLNYKDVQIVAVCDVVEERSRHNQKVVNDFYSKARNGKGFKGCEVYKDFRKLTDRKDIDAVVIATPDHWHTIPCLYASKAGKDVYCEKPLTLTIAEGRKLVEVAKKNKTVFQTGSQQRSEFGNRFRRAVELVRNGYIGKVKTVRIGVGDPNVPCDLPTQAIPDGTDWDLWLGPAPKRGYNEILCPKGVHRHFPAWRRYREYAGGGLADMGAHHFDIAQWALGMDNSGPVKIIPPKDKKDKRGLKFIYANGTEMFHGGPSGCTFVGTKGTIYVDRGRMTSTPADILKVVLDRGAFRVYPSRDHRRNWLDCIRSRKDPICTAEIGHRSATVCHLGNLGYQLRRELEWDPQKEQFLGDEEANKLRSREMRKPWSLG